MDNVQVLLKVCGSVLSVFNPWIMEQKKKNFLFLQNWVHNVPIFF